MMWYDTQYTLSNLKQDGMSRAVDSSIVPTSTIVDVDRFDNEVDWDRLTSGSDSTWFVELGNVLAAPYVTL